MRLHMCLSSCVSCFGCHVQRSLRHDMSILYTTVWTKTGLAVHSKCGVFWAIAPRAALIVGHLLLTKTQTVYTLRRIDNARFDSLATAAGTTAMRRRNRLRSSLNHFWPQRKRTHANNSAAPQRNGLSADSNASRVLLSLLFNML